MSFVDRDIRAGLLMHGVTCECGCQSERRSVAALLVAGRAAYARFRLGNPRTVPWPSLEPHAKEFWTEIATAAIDAANREAPMPDPRPIPEELVAVVRPVAWRYMKGGAELHDIVATILAHPAARRFVLAEAVAGMTHDVCWNVNRAWYGMDGGKRTRDFKAALLAALAGEGT